MAWAKWNTKQLFPGCTGRNIEEPWGNKVWKECPQHYGPLQVVTWHAMAPASFRHCPGSILPLPCTIMGAVLPHPSSLAWPRGAPIAQQQPHVSVINAVLACTRATSKQILQLSNSSKWQLFEHCMMELTYHRLSPRSPNYSSNCKYQCKKNTERNYDKKHEIIVIKCTHLNEFSISQFHWSTMDFKMQSFEKHYSEFNEQTFCKCCRFYIIYTDYILITTYLIFANLLIAIKSPIL